MEKIVSIQPYQKAIAADFSNMGLYARASFDHLVNDFCYPGAAYTGFATVETAPTQVTVGNGRLTLAGQIFANESPGGQVVDLTSLLPLATSLIVAIVVSGAPVDTNVQPRTFLTDPVSRASIARQVATENDRIASIGTLKGVEAPDPQVPNAPQNVVVVAYVRLGTTGIVSVTQNSAALATNIQSLAKRADGFDAFQLAVGSQLSTLRSDLTNLAGKLNGLASANDLIAVAEDVARLKDKAGLPQSYSAYGSDHFLSTDYTDLTSPDLYCKIMEGVRFPDIQVEDDQIGLLNPLDANVVNVGNFVLPAYDNVTRISQIGTDAALPISNSQQQILQAVQLSRTRTRIRYGASFNVCSNSSWYQSGRYDSNGVFVLNGETFNVVDTGQSYGAFGGSPADHEILRVTEFWTDTYTEEYWSSVTVTQGYNGAVVAEGWLNTQAGYLLEIGLYFKQAASAGDVTVLLVACDSSGPQMDSQIASATIAVADIKISTPDNLQRVPAKFAPTFLKAGQRYAFVVVTPANHYLWMTTGNKYVDGVLFNSSSNGNFFLGDLTNDIAFDAVFAQFRASQIQVQLNALQLAGGIVGIDLLALTSVPDGSSLTFAVQQNGIISPIDASLSLIGLPAILPFYAIFQGTSAIMPGLGVGSNSRTETSRPATRLEQISKPVTLEGGATVNTVHIDVRLEYWRGAPHHTFVAKLRTGTNYAVVNAAAVVTTEVPIEDPNAIIYHFIFSGFAAPINSWVWELDGTTDAATALYHVAELDYVGLNT